LPLTIVSELQNDLLDRKLLFLCAFGVGLSWATAIIHVEDCIIPSIVEV